ncbi:hypothetical protein GH865_03855 [Rhodocyclus tenuis]|uniref:DUF6129 family protein n=1 Tax=Rhodocyclus gracilis TaxID=2929842 RepID=UPI001298A668|nr:DUF6129 family protein [Rhodocyclus gracilis]MRD72387.1 hypothetical protein [Rhodocyclus gracilis]
MIDDAVLHGVLATVASARGPAACGDGLAHLLRERFPDLHSITVCADDDTPARLSPAASNEVCSLYFVSAGEHCLSLTSDPAGASGLVVALHDED